VWFQCKGHTVDIATHSAAMSLLRRSRVARVVEGFHSFTCAPTRLSADGINHTYLWLSIRSWFSFIDPEGMEGWVGRGTTTVCPGPLSYNYRTSHASCICTSIRFDGRSMLQLSQLLAAQAVTPHWATGAQRSVELTTSRAVSRDANH